MNSTALKYQGIAQTSSHHPNTLEWVLTFIGQCRTGRLRRAEKHDEVFTIEEIVRQYEDCFYVKVPHNLNGAIGSQARRLGYVEGFGPYVESKRDSRHSNKVELLRWKPEILQF